MFLDKDRDYLTVNLHSTRYLGKQDILERFLELLSRYNGVYLPQKWDTDERAKRVYDRSNLSDLIKEWTIPKKTQFIFFSTKKPVEVQMYFRFERHARAKFNDFSLYIRDKHFDDRNRIKDFVSFVLEVASIISADYGLISHATQERRQSPVLTPGERLPGIYWANFFGRPYIDFFGREKLLATPCHEVREINENLILLLTAESPYSSEMLDNDNVVNRVRAYLNQNAFPGPRFPDEPCAVPKFDFSDLRVGTEQPAVPPKERLNRIRLELEAKGNKLIEQSESHLKFRGEGDSIILVDAKTGTISLDMTGEAPLK